MKKVKWKALIISCLFCLAPILLGIAFYDRLPDMVPIHFDINNTPDNFAPKAFAVFGLPLLMAFFNIIACAVPDLAGDKNCHNKFDFISKWILPVISIVIYTSMIFFSLGEQVDIRRIAVFIVSVLFLVLGNYLPKSKYFRINGKIKQVVSDADHKRMRLMGYITVAMGLIFLASIFLPPISSIIALFLLIPYTILTVIFAFKIGKE